MAEQNKTAARLVATFVRLNNQAWEAWSEMHAGETSDESLLAATVKFDILVAQAHQNVQDIRQADAVFDVLCLEEMQESGDGWLWAAIANHPG